jgi:transcriptional regulator with XRE-family HTH domain
LLPRKLFYGALVASKKSTRKPAETGAPKPEKPEATPSKPNHHERLKGFGRNVRGFRTALGWSVEKLAEEADLSVNHVAAIERGEVDPGYSTYRKLVVALGVTPDVLVDEPFRGKEGMPVPTRGFADLFERAPPDFQEHVKLRLLQGIAKARDKK